MTQQYNFDADELSCELDRDFVAKGGLAAFVQLAWSHVEPVPLIWSPHLDLICAHYEAVARGECRELVVNVPPGMSKSTITCVFFPAWRWIGDATKRFMFTSYSNQLTQRDAARCADLINGDWFQKRWGFQADQAALERRGLKPFAIGDLGAREPSKSFAARFYYTTSGGQRFSTMFGGQATGFHADILCADDASKPADIQAGGDQARANLEKVWTRWTQTFSTRSRDPKTFARIIIAQRLHELDLPGQAVTAGATHLRLPMEFEPDSRCVTPWGEDWRTEEGELLCPERFPRDEVEKRKAAHDTRTWISQYQQRPSPEQGELFKREWMTQRWTALPPYLRLCISVDCSLKAGASSDYTVVQVWGQHGPNFYLADQVRGRFEVSAIIQAIRDLKAKWPRCTTTLIEEAASGVAVLQTLEREFSGVIGVKPLSGKFARASAAEPYFRAMNVWLPNEAWTNDFVEELVGFPTGAAHDDQVDACTQAIAYLAEKNHGPRVLSAAMSNWRDGTAQGWMLGADGVRSGLVRVK